KVDVEIQNHALFDDTEGRIAKFKTRKPGDPNPLLMPIDKYTRMWGVVSECIRAEIARRPSNYPDTAWRAYTALLLVANHPAAAAALSSGRVLKAIAAPGAALRIALMTASNNARPRGGRRTPPPMTTQS